MCVSGEMRAPEALLRGECWMPPLPRELTAQVSSDPIYSLQEGKGKSPQKERMRESKIYTLISHPILTLGCDIKVYIELPDNPKHRQTPNKGNVLFSFLV